MAEWMPIETAPRDGTDVLCWVGFTYTPEQHVILHWSEGDWITDYMVDYWAASYEPTHWQPLPDPPEENP